MRANKVFFLKKAKFISLVFITLSSFQSLADTDLTSSTVINAPKSITESDFKVTINGHQFSLGEKWDDLAMKKAGVQLSESFVGDVPSGNSSYKYYQHSYAGYEIYSSNLFWEKEHRDIDSYIISQVTINNAGIKTARGVSIGDQENVLTRHYGKGTLDDSDDQHWIYYDGDGERISFQIENNKVSHIMMALDNDN